MKDVPCSSKFVSSLFFLALLGPGCAPSLTMAAAQIREAPPEGVGQCVFLGTVVGRARHRVDDAKTDALNRAADRGATHLVWLSVSGGRGATAMGRAYRCSGG
jgi:flavin-binding protein dodecin